MYYLYHLDYELPLEGINNLVYGMGSPIVVLVSKENPKISFFSHFGRIDEYDTIPKNGLKIFKMEENGS